MIDKDFCNALLPPRTQVLQVQLLPFSLGHLVTLARTDSPFLIGGAFKPLELFAAVRICTLNWRQCQEFVADSGDWANQFQEWFKKVGPVDYAEKARLFCDYLEKGYSRPDYQVPEIEGSVQEIWTPLGQRMRVKLMRELGLSDDEVMDRPLTVNWYDYLTLLESEGSCKILTSEEKERADAMFSARVEDVCLAQN